MSDGATVVCTSKGDVLALYEYTTKKIGLRQQNILKIQVKKILRIKYIFFYF